MRAQFILRGNALVQALAGDGREFEFDHIEPGSIFGRVMDLEAGGQHADLGGRQVLVKDGIGVGVQVVPDQHGFLGLGVVSSQILHKAAIVGARALGGGFHQALARTRFAGDQRAVPWRTYAVLSRWSRPALAGRHGQQRRNGRAVQHAGPLIEADDGKARVVERFPSLCTHLRFTFGDEGLFT